ncbi:MAG: alpha-galactosidase [Acidimicrobiales bacterium]
MIVGYAYPWDFEGDPAAATRAAELGCDTVALAATYHSSRTVSPLHPTRRMFEVSTSAAYVALRPEAWRSHRLVPSRPSWPGGETAFTTAAHDLREAGLDVAAWIVVTHHDELGLANPDLVVRNAYGDPYSYALCPSAPEVREYARTLVTEVIAASDVDRVVLEACGPMGLSHSGVHDKVEYAGFNAVARDLLSICCCSSCARAFAANGLDAKDVAHLIQRGLHNQVGSFDEAFDAETAQAVRATRAEVGASLQRAVLDGVVATHPEVAVTIHGSLTPGATGSFPEVGVETLARVATVVANAWDATSAPEEIAALAGATSEGTRLGAYLRLDRGWDEPVIEPRVAQYRRAGVDEWHLYHLGLLSEDGLVTMHRVIETARAGEGPR